MTAEDDVTVLRDEIEAYDDGTVARVRVLRVPVSDRFREGSKYAFHYGEAGAESPAVRFDNHHGVHELHLVTARSRSTFRDCNRSTARGAQRSRPRNEPTGDHES